jgi:triosephosphate isomerase
LIAGPASAQTDRAADKAVVEKTVREFTTSYATKDDDKKIVSYVYEPWLQIGTGKALNKAEAEKTVAEFRSTFPKDYDHLNVKQLSSKMLGKDFAMVSYVGERQTKDNKVLQTVAGSLFLKRTDAGWKIAAGINYPPEDYIKLD